jgi:predicted NBD/HSP70 family sugar kinase
MYSGDLRGGAQFSLDSRSVRGTNQSGMRDSNERLVLSLLRRHGALSKTDIARVTGLSTQTVSVIMRKLEEDGLLRRGEPIRGRIGQPSVPMSLDPEGALFLGLKIGRRSAELVLIDFVGRLKAIQQLSYRYPTPDETISFVTTAMDAIRADLTAAQDGRIAGLGIAIPFELWNWADTADAPPSVMEEWRHRDIRADIQARCRFPVYLQNDATAACGAELVFGRGAELRDFVYFYIGAFAGGGIVLNGAVYSGASGNAGALGSMPVPGPDGTPIQLIDVASIALLEKALNATDVEAQHLWTSPQDWGDVGLELDRWIEQSGAALAYATVAACSVIDFEGAVIDGWMPASIRSRMVSATQAALAGIDTEGISVPSIREGSVGHNARAIGAASLPLSDRFLLGTGQTLKAV